MEKIINNCDVLQSIFDYLDFDEHWKLIKICPQFKFAVVHGVWRLRYKNLNIEQSYPGTFVLRYNAVKDVKKERTLISAELGIILYHSSMYIQKLELKDISCLENIIHLKYHNLTELSLRDIVVEDTDLQQVAENCLNLQSLSLISFTNSIYHSNIRPNVFGEMKALNKLEINDIYFTAWNYFDVQQLFCHAHLKTLIIDIDIRDSNINKGNNNNSINRVNDIENLTIETLPRLQSTKVCFIEDLIRFENLTKLSITLNRVIIDDDDLTQINNACPKLCELSLTGCNFCFKEFPRMNNLKHLTFEWCKDISLKNVDEIFRKLKLKSLSLVSVELRDEAEDISDYNYISNTLETLNIEDIYYNRNTVTKFCNQQHKFENVSKVRLRTNSSYRSQSTRLCFSLSFPYLQEFITDSYYISSEDILHLKHLKVLQFDLFDNMSWSYLEILFQHPTLTHVTITPFSCLDFEMPNCCEGLTTKLEYLCLPSVVYERTLDFWPSFRQRNKLLKLEIEEGWPNVRNLRTEDHFGIYLLSDNLVRWWKIKYLKLFTVK